jgi:hypothetical protein
LDEHATKESTKMKDRIKPKYRLLSLAELEELEKEFVDFLVLNGITADHWMKIKEDEKEVAEDMIVLFSDVVMEGVLRKVQFLEIRSKNDIKTFQCLGNKIILMGITAEGTTDVDFSDQLFISQCISNPPKGVKLYTSEKEYSNVREMELFGMISAGCTIADGGMFKVISLALVDLNQG